MRRGFDSEDPKAHINNHRRRSSNQSYPDFHSSVQEPSPSASSSSTYATSYPFDPKIAPSNRVIDFGASSSTSFPSPSPAKSAWLWPTISSPLCTEGEVGPKRAKKPNDLHEDRMTSSAFVGTKSVAANSNSNSSSSAVGGSATAAQPSSDLCSSVVPFVPSARHDRSGVGGGTLLEDSSGLTKGEGRKRNSDFRCSSPSPLTFSNASSLSSPLASTSSSVHFSAPTCAQQQQQPLQERYVEEQKPFEHFLNSGTRNLVTNSDSLRKKQEQDKVGSNSSQNHPTNQPHQHQHQQQHSLQPQQLQHHLHQHHQHHQQQQQQQQQQNHLQSYPNHPHHHPLQASSGGHTGTSAVLSGHNATMQPATDYLRPYIHYPATAAALYHSAATMAPTAASRLEQTGLGDRTVPFPSINPLAASQHPIASNYSHRYDTGLPAHHQALYSSSYSAFESPYTSQITPTTHIPLGGGDYAQHPQQHHSAQPQNQQQQQRYFLARPQPTRLLPASAVSTDLVSPQQTRSQTSPYSIAAAKMDNILNNNNNNNHQHHNNTNNTGSPHNPNASSSPSTNIDSNGNLSPASDRNDASSNKFRYPSGANNSVQSSSASSPPHMDRGGGRAITPSSALSSREGTPMPSANNRDEPLAPNVDISKVQAKEIQQNNKQQQMQTFMQSQVTAAGPTAVGAAAPSLAQQNFHFGMGAASSIPTRGFVGTSPSYFPSSGPVNSMLDSSIAQRPPKQRPPREASLHVKIGRRPAHLPKVLKFTDKTLPSGWVRKLKQRKHGKQAGRWDVYIYSPCGVKFASRKKLKSFFEKNNLTHDPEDFDFTPYGRHIESRTNHASNTSGSSVGTVSSSIGTLDSGAASRHNSSGSTGSNGTHPGSCSPASISYSPTYSLNNYIPPSMAFSTASTTTGAGLMPTSASSFVDYNNFQFDPHMDNPPNANVLDVPPNEFNTLGGGSPLPYAHLGRGHHHPIMNKGGTMGSEFFPSSEMADLIGSSTNELHNGYSSDLKMGLQSLGGSLTATKLNDDQDLADKINLPSEKSQGPSAHQVASTACYSTAISVSPTSVMANPTQASVSLPSVANSHGHENAHEKAFSLGRTINMLQGGQEGFEDSYFYD